MPEGPDLYVLAVIVSDLREMIRLAAETGLPTVADKLKTALAEAEDEARRRRAP